MARPFIVYLDSSDWSNLAAAACDGPFRDREVWLDVRRRLLAARDSGRVEFRFSQALVVEAYPMAPSHHAQGVARAKAIAELCGPLCLVETNSLTRMEIVRLAGGDRPPFERSIAMRDDGAWHHDPDGLAGKLNSTSLADARSHLDELIQNEMPRLSRAERRALIAANTDKKGRVSGAVKERLLDATIQRSVRLDALERVGPLPDAVDLSVFARVMAGELPASAADQVLLHLLRDVPTLFSLVPTRTHAEQLFGFLRDAGKQLAEPMAEAAANLKRGIAQFGYEAFRERYLEKPFVDPFDWRTRTRAKILSALWEVERKSRGSVKRIRGETWFRYVANSEFGAIPSLDAYLAAGAALVAKASRLSKEPYKGRVSDAGDVLHMSYLPYVDVMRCDSGNAQLAIAAAAELKLGARVAPTIGELLKLIEGGNRAA